jgi:hypothetical protein
MRLNRFFILFSVMLLSLSFAFPQGRGGRQGGQGSGRGQGGGFGRRQGSEQGQINRNPQAGAAQAEHRRIKTTERQKEQIRSCSKLAEAVRKQAGKMAKNSGKN